MLLMSVFAALLFLLLTPGVVVTLPPRSSKLVTALTHAAIFGLVWHLTHKTAWHYLSGR